MEHTKIASPCVSVCKSDPISGFCYGCGRTDAEKDKWRDKSTTINWKKENILELKSRLSGWVLVAFEKSYANKINKINKIN